MNIQPLYTGFRSTTIWKAFILNSLASSIIIFLAIFLKGYFDKYHDQDDNKIQVATTWKSVLITMSVTFVATFGTYALMWFTLGYGGGQLTSQ